MYKNEQNDELVKQINRINRNKIQREKAANHELGASITTRLEGVTMRDSTIKGGNAYAESKIGDMAFTKTQNGIVGSGLSETSVLETNTRKRKTKKEGGANLSLANIEIYPKPDPPLSKPIEITAPTTNPEQKQPVRRRKKPLAIENGAVGGSKPKRVNKYALLVKEIMAKNSIKSLAEASKYIKENKLYTPLAK